MSSAAIVVLIATVAACLAAWAGWRLDQRRLACATRWRAVPAVLLMLVSAWIAVLVPVTFALRVPGAYGPVQYWYSDPDAMGFIFGARVVAMFAILGGMWVLAPITIIATLVSLWRPSRVSARRRLVLPALALAVFGVAFTLFWMYRFYPTA